LCLSSGTDMQHLNPTMRHELKDKRSAIVDEHIYKKQPSCEPTL